ncbi:Fic family protein [Sphingobacterium sp. DN00404]|uniref:Fic family protein n=1 Tax=Sphingobacterium micropteri TaxID=2763501 RepID=A0ABR7YNX5_9SPHI|nr:Fic family protein [Sphingobacterium micropteri]MBD1432936.1 Fic family protein [Sphingobacterium micropteri]
MQPIGKTLALKEELDTLLPLSMEMEDSLMQQFRFDWNYHSNSLEGNSLTYIETKALLLHGITTQGKPLKDHLEITGHDEAIKWIEELVKGDYPLTENFIRELHTLLLKSPYEVKAITPDGQPTTRRIAVGQYKTAPNHVKTRTGEIFRFAAPEETPAQMHDLISWYRSESEVPEVNPIILAAEFHYRFIRIHPFDDGNGRTARIIMNFILMKFCYPPAIIKTEDKQSYFSTLRQADGGKIDPFIDYIAQNLIRSLKIMILGAKGQDIEDEDDAIKELTLLKARLKKEKRTKSPKLAHNTVKNFMENIKPYLEETLAEISDLFAESKSTIFVNGKQFNPTVGDLLANNSALMNIAQTDSLRKLVEKRSLSIFGIDLYKEDLKDITWRTENLGLKGGNNKTTLVIDVNLVLENTYPLIKINVKGQKPIQHIFDYEDSIDRQVISQLQKQLLRNMTSEIKLMI